MPAVRLAAVITMLDAGNVGEAHAALVELNERARRTAMEINERTKCRHKGEEMDIGNARMMLTKAELEEVEVTLADGSVIRPFRFCEIDPVIGSGENGILSF